MTSKSSSSSRTKWAVVKKHARQVLGPTRQIEAKKNDRVSLAPSKWSLVRSSLSQLAKEHEDVNNGSSPLSPFDFVGVEAAALSARLSESNSSTRLLDPKNSNSSLLITAQKHLLPLLLDEDARDGRDVLCRAPAVGGKTSAWLLWLATLAVGGGKVEPRTRSASQAIVGGRKSVSCSEKFWEVSDEDDLVERSRRDGGVPPVVVLPPPPAGMGDYCNAVSPPGRGRGSEGMRATSTSDDTDHAGFTMSSIPHLLVLVIGPGRTLLQREAYVEEVANFCDHLDATLHSVAEEQLDERGRHRTREARLDAALLRKNSSVASSAVFGPNGFCTVGSGEKPFTWARLHVNGFSPEPTVSSVAPPTPIYSYGGETPGAGATTPVGEGVGDSVPTSTSSRMDPVLDGSIRLEVEDEESEGGASISNRMAEGSFARAPDRRGEVPLELDVAAALPNDSQDLLFPALSSDADVFLENIRVGGEGEESSASSAKKESLAASEAEDNDPSVLSSHQRSCSPELQHLCCNKVKLS